ncbi:GvpL/GvpF family gas vesicle protein [Pseudonocardia spinosispora]|uniref:GvpL/GvpF family gas vesicle protein n=1 Tax=Pseudonocardia spinosispora TaxID=103441 RepID=UPI000401AD30|nr:GvpL/GvpF family gas vesicle protein [Pseudonocardia spinosispora]
MTPTYVYGLVAADTVVPEGLSGLGPSERVSTVTHGQVAAIVSDVPIDRPLGTRDDLIAHETVVDAVARSAAVLPMRFPAVVEDHGIVEELLAPNHDHFLQVLTALEGRVQFTLKGRYEQDTVLRELLRDNTEIRELRDQVGELPEDASYYDRVRLGELIVAELERRRDDEAAGILDRLEPTVVDLAARHPATPEDVINVAFLVERAHQQRFEDSVEDLGRDLDGRVRFRLLGPLAPYDFVPEA